MDPTFLSADTIVARQWDAVVWMGDFNSRIDGYKFFKGKTDLKYSQEKAVIAALECEYYG